MLTLDKTNCNNILPTPIYAVKENIRVGGIDIVENLEQKIQSAAAATHADRFIRSLEQGIETHLGRWFTEGTDLSAGQWQRLALTRAVFRDAPVLVLDEPTSAMDAITEADWVKQFPGIRKGSGEYYCNLLSKDTFNLLCQPILIP